MIGSIIFDGINCANYGIYVTDPDSNNAPDRIYEIESVPGRNGTLSYDTGAFNNIKLNYPAFVYSDIDENLRAFRNFLASKNGYKRLEDSFHTDEYRMARFSSDFSVEKTADSQMGRAVLEFDCKPQRFLKSGEEPVEFTESGTITNPTLFDSNPLIRIYGTGVIGIDTVNITFDGSSEYVDIDCDIQDAYYGAVNKNASIVLSPNEFPNLHVGENGIVLGTGITRVVVTPRWWQI